MTITRRIAGLAAIAASLYASSPAFAHHMMGGKMPSTLTQGLLSGIGHPIIGVDHFLFIVGVGLLGGILGRKLLIPLAFVFGTWLGAGLHLFSLNIAFAEVAIVASIVLMAVAVIGHVRAPSSLMATLVAAAGIFHGYAYAESIFGAEPTPLYAYLAGFAIIQFLIAITVATLFELVQKRSDTLATAGMRVAGGAMAGVAMTTISSMALPIPG
jgi:urease accessory protein